MKEKILIIEDDFTIQTQLKTLLYGNGYEVICSYGFSKTIESVKRSCATSGYSGYKTSGE